MVVIEDAQQKCVDQGDLYFFIKNDTWSKKNCVVCIDSTTCKLWNGFLFFCVLHLGKNTNKSQLL